MSNVVSLSPGSAPPAHDPEPRRALRDWGRWLARVFGCLLALGTAFAASVLTLGLVCGGVFIWLAPGAAYIGPVPTGMPGLVPFGDLPVPTRWAYSAIFVLNTARGLLILTDLRGLARAYAEGVAFGLDGVKRLRRVSLGLVACALAPAVGHGLVLLASHGVDLDWLHASSFHALVLAAITVALAEVARVGHAVETDRDVLV